VPWLLENETIDCGRVILVPFNSPRNSKNQISIILLDLSNGLSVYGHYDDR
jgi:hypothetical protein